MERWKILLDGGRRVLKHLWKEIKELIAESLL
jgi:hypothetical protein